MGDRVVAREVVVVEPAQPGALFARLEMLPDAAVAGAVLGIVQEPLHVVVARDDPEAERRDVVDGILAPKLMRERRRVARLQEIEEEIGGGLVHGIPFDHPQAGNRPVAG